MYWGGMGLRCLNPSLPGSEKLADNRSKGLMAMMRV